MDNEWLLEDGTVDTSNLEWVEGMATFERWSVSPEESVWVCCMCGMEVDDPYEEGCLQCGNGATLDDDDEDCLND